MPETNAQNRPARHKGLIVLLVILALQLGASYALSISERPLPLPQLGLIPPKIGTWFLGAEEPLESEVMAQLRPDDYIVRTYQQGGQSVSLFVAYFKSLQNNFGPHSPRACLPASGWLTHAWDIVDLPIPGRPAGIPVNKYLLEKDGQKILVLYWYQNNRRVWAEDFGMKLNLLPDLIRYHRSDISLVRVITSVDSAGSIDKAFRTVGQFTGELFPTLIDRFDHTS
jgi:EpsI family protein